MVFFGKGSGATNEPKRATVFTFMIAITVIWAGDLNAVAEVLSMFFLIAYGMINLCGICRVEKRQPELPPDISDFTIGPPGWQERSVAQSR